MSLRQRLVELLQTETDPDPDPEPAPAAPDPDPSHDPSGDADDFYGTDPDPETAPEPAPAAPDPEPEPAPAAPDPDPELESLVRRVVREERSRQVPDAARYRPASQPALDDGLSTDQLAERLRHNDVSDQDIMSYLTGSK